MQSSPEAPLITARVYRGSKFLYEHAYFLSLGIPFKRDNKNNPYNLNKDQADSIIAKAMEYGAYDPLRAQSRDSVEVATELLDFAVKAWNEFGMDDEDPEVRKAKEEIQELLQIAKVSP